jgi:anti-sigma factor ChrR (cupin superfamily)
VAGVAVLRRQFRNAKVQLVNVIGDPSKPGLYIQLEKVAPHVVIPAHHHAGDRTVTVIQGSLMFGNGPKFDRSKLKVMPVGSIYTDCLTSRPQAISPPSPR